MKKIFSSKIFIISIFSIFLGFAYFWFKNRNEYYYKGEIETFLPPNFSSEDLQNNNLIAEAKTGFIANMQIYGPEDEGNRYFFAYDVVIGTPVNNFVDEEHYNTYKTITLEDGRTFDNVLDSQTFSTSIDFKVYKSLKGKIKEGEVIKLSENATVDKGSVIIGAGGVIMQKDVFYLVYLPSKYSEKGANEFTHNSRNFQAIFNIDGFDKNNEKNERIKEHKALKEKILKKYAKQISEVAKEVNKEREKEKKENPNILTDEAKISSEEIK